MEMKRENSSVNLHSLAQLYSHIFYEFNIDTLTVSYVYFKDKVVRQNATISELLDYIITTEDLIKEERKNILDTLEKQRRLNASSFELFFSCIKNNGDVVDYILKGIRKGSNVLCAINQIHADKQAIDLRDTLSKAYTSDAIMSYLKREFIKPHKEFILLNINIDNFEQIVEQYGKSFSYVILAEVSYGIKSVLKNHGILGRLENDIFIAIIYIDTSNVDELCQKLLNRIRNISSNNSKNAKISATISCTCYPQHGITLDSHLDKLKKAMAYGKNNGKDCYVIYNDEKCKNQKYKNYNFENFENDSLHDPEMQIISSIFDMMNRDIPIHKNIADSLELVGSFFLLDRIVFNILTDDKNKIFQTLSWNNPQIPNLKELQLPSTSKSIQELGQFINRSGYWLCSRIPENYENDKCKEIYDFLSKQNTKASLAYELKDADNKLVGSIRFDVCKKHHVWNKNELHYLGLITKIFTSSIEKFRLEQLIEEKLNKDELTNLDNQSKFITQSSEFLLNSKQPTTLLYFNIGHFQMINEQYGYEDGNNVLKRFANLLETTLDEDSFLCRINADKFMALIKTHDDEKINSVFKTLSDNLITVKNTKSLRKITLLCSAYKLKEKDTIYNAMNMAMLTAQTITSSDTSSLVLYKDAFNQEAQISMNIERHMFNALNDNEFYVYYQPKFDMKTNKVIGAEALTRWFFKHKDLIPPYKFIPIFEKNGFILELDFYVFEKVCKFISSQLKENKTLFPISVNMSRYQVNFSQFIQKIEEIRRKYEVPANLIEIEITEGLATNIEAIKILIDKLHAIGYLVSMDDFGSGYSNFAALSKLNFDTIKIDKCLCPDSSTPKDEIIIAAVISMAKQLNINVLSEGVETQAQADKLIELGCNQAQGWLYEKAIPEKDFIEKYLK